MATVATAERLEVAHRIATARDDEFSAICWWECFVMCMGTLGHQAANDISFDRAQDTVNSLVADRDARDAAAARLAKPTCGDIQRVLLDTIRRQFATTGAGRALQMDARGQALAESLIKNIVGNATYAIADLFAVEE